MSAERRADAAAASIDRAGGVHAALLRLTDRLGDACLSSSAEVEVPVRLRLEASVASPPGEIVAVERREIAGRPGIELTIAAPGLGGSMSQCDPPGEDPMEDLDPGTRALVEAAFHRLQVLRHMAWRRATGRWNGTSSPGETGDHVDRSGMSPGLAAALRTPRSADTLLGLAQERCDPWPVRLESRCEVRARLRSETANRIGRGAALGDDWLLGGLACERISTFDLIVGTSPEDRGIEPPQAIERIRRRLGTFLPPLVPTGMVCRIWLELPRPDEPFRLGAGSAWAMLGRTAWLARGHSRVVRIAVGSAGRTPDSPRTVDRIRPSGAIA